MNKNIFVINLFKEVHRSCIADGQFYSAFLPIEVSGHDVSSRYHFVVLRFYEDLETGFLSAIAESPTIFFCSARLFSDFAYSVCSRLSAPDVSSNDCEALLFAGVFLVNTVHFSLLMRCYHLTMSIPNVFLRFFNNKISATFSTEGGFENLRAFCDRLQADELLRKSLIRYALSVIDDAIENEISARETNECFSELPTLLDALKLKYGCVHCFQFRNRCLFCGTNCVIDLLDFLEHIEQHISY
ncbi:hypothetical protein CEXT_375051 [Caerostris extrusa]|uniref:C2H2-type domain-containing protein n=1 Tax=Caerostris extrusa TaxID=172846 RepID=A0AAV4UAM1_CAEEX|nr:hypothetical protein CEXT_375051 [Caerostris extrusa]